MKINLASPKRICSKGLTLIELMVAMALALLVIAIALIVVSAASSGLGTSSGASQLNDSSMLVNNLLQRATVQAGFQRLDKPDFTRETYYAHFGKLPFPDVYGQSLQTMSAEAGSVSPSDIQSFYNGEGSNGLATQSSSKYDLLAIRFQAIPEQQKEDDGITAMLDLCSSQQLSADPYSNYDANDPSEAYKPIYVFFVAQSKQSDNGDVLYCKAYNGVKNSNATATAITDGVVGFKILYGLFPPESKNLNGAPVVWKTAAQLSEQEWHYVKRIRIGLVLQSQKGATKLDTVPALYPLGQEYSSTSNPGSVIEGLSASEGRLYREINFTVSVKNMLLPTNFARSSSGS